jgi:hypothetical protein
VHEGRGRPARPPSPRRRQFLPIAAALVCAVFMGTLLRACQSEPAEAAGEP